MKNPDSKLARLRRKARAQSQLIKQAPHPYVTQRAILVMIMLIIGAILVVVAVNRKPNPRVVDGSKGIVPIKTNAPEATSSLCNKITASQVESSIDQNVEKSESGIPDTKTQEGTVTSCTYTLQASPSQKIRSISVIERSLHRESNAQQAYAQLTQSGGKSISNTERDAFILPNSNQLIIRKDNRVITVTIARVSSGAQDFTATLEQLSELF